MFCRERQKIKKNNEKNTEKQKVEKPFYTSCQSKQ